MRHSSFQQMLSVHWKQGKDQILLYCIILSIFMSIFQFVHCRKNDDYKEINIPAGKTYEVYVQDL